jgi:hypothetical protein
MSHNDRVPSGRLRATGSLLSKALRMIFPSVPARLSPVVDALDARRGHDESES